MKKGKIIGTAIILLLILPACAVQEINWPGYSGTLDGYKYYHTEERNREWEEDILYMAERFLEEHPLLSDSDSWIMTLNDWSDNIGDEYSYELSNVHYNENIHGLFLDQINILIPRVGDLNDVEICYELSRIVALLKDGHSYVSMEAGELIPLLFENVGRETELQLCTVRVPQAYSHLLGSELSAINGTPIEIIVASLTEYLSSDNVYFPIYQMTNLYDITYVQLLTQKPALEIIGIVASEDSSAEFTFETENGMIMEKLDFIPPSEYVKMELIEHYMVSSSSYLFQQERNFWYTIVENTDTPYLYMRIRKMRPDVMDFNQFYTQVASELKSSEIPLRLIIDFRDNSGGELQIGITNSFAQMVNRYGTNGTYILINGGCFSAGAIAPYILTNSIDGAKLIGSPTGQPGNNFGPSSCYCTPNNNLTFSVSYRFYCHIPEEELDAIYPDNTVYQTWEDYQNNVDTVLEYVLALG